MSFIKNMYEYKKAFHDIERRSKNRVYLKCDINIIYEYIYIYIYIERE